MLALKNFMQKCMQSGTEKRYVPQNNRSVSTPRTYRAVLDENQVILLTQWLDRLDRQKLVTITAQNDIVIMAGGINDRNQQIFINSDDVGDYMKTKMISSRATDKTKIIGISDIARILLKYGYVNETAGQLSFKAQTIEVDSEELAWLTSIVYDARPDPQARETHVKLFDGENTQLLSIPYEFMAPTNNARNVAIYLFRNGHVRYDVDSGAYAYRYVEPDILLDDETQSPERISQHQMLSFHIRRIHVDEQRQRVEVEFLHEPTYGLVLPTRWYSHVLAHNFDRNYIIDILLANGGYIDRDAFIFMGRTYSLQGPRITRSASASGSSTYLKAMNLSSKQKYDLTRQFVDYVVRNDGTKQDESNGLLLLQNAADGRRLYFTPMHSQFIRQNQFQRQDVIDVLYMHGQIRQDQSGNWLLYYNNQYIRFPASISLSYIGSQQNLSNIGRPSSERLYSNIRQTPRSFSSTRGNESEADFRSQYHSKVDYMCRNGLITWDKRANVIKLQFSDQTSLLPIEHLRSIIDPRVLSSASTVDGALPFTSRQLSEYLLNNSYITRKNPLRS